MEDIPPSYNEINANVLDLLPPYLTTASLVNLCLVSKAYNRVFIPHLWGSPASHFVEVANDSSRTTNGISFANLQVTGSQNDMVYVALTRFKRILRRARLSTRSLCHTLHLPPALSEIYGGPNSTWLRDVLDWLPALQSLCVSGLPFFDHDSLVAVDQTRLSNVPSNPNDEDFRQYSVKMLLAAKEPNVTWSGLTLLMPHLPHLVYLDLSYTSSARNANVLRSLDALPHLQILKLRGIGLKDNELEVLANVLKLRVRLLDVAENLLTDMSVRSLLQACVWLPSTPSINGHMPNDQYFRQNLESWPVGLPPPPDSQSLDAIRTVELDEALLNQLTSPLTGRLAFEDIPHGGITHLYIGANPGVTIESIRSILDLGRLHVLDAGDIAVLTPLDLQVLAARRYSASNREHGHAKSASAHPKHKRALLTRRRSRPSSITSFDSGPLEDQMLEDEDFRLPGAEKLVPVLREQASKNLTHLRIDHTVATSVLDVKEDLKEKDENIATREELPDTLSQAAELDAVNREIHEAAGSRAFPQEMSSEPTVFEMDATPARPRVELQGDMIYFALSPAIGDAPPSSLDEVMSPIRGEGAMAPEVVSQNKKDNAEEDIVLNATGSGLARQPTFATISTVSTLDTTNSGKSQHSSKDNTSHQPLRNVESIKEESTKSESISVANDFAEIDRLTKSRPQGLATSLHPSFLPNLRTLILTSVPEKVSATSTGVIDNLKAFITACATETRLALLKAQTNYSLPPGRARQDGERQHARSLFALRTIVLEISPEPDKRTWKQARLLMNISKSSTGDPDSEALWSAADNDFSFFGEEGEEADECGIYDQEPDKYYPTSIPYDDKIVVSNDDRIYNLQSSGTSSPHSSSFSLASPLSPRPLGRNSTIMQSPRNLPLGRRRRTSNETYGASHSPTASETRLPSRSGTSTFYAEVTGSTPTYRQIPPTSNPTQAQIKEQPKMLDVVAELAKWRRERKAEFENAMRNRARRPSAVGRLAETEVFIDGYWPGEVKVIRNAKKSTFKGKSERQGNVDVYGNYFEGGYLYP